MSTTYLSKVSSGGCLRPDVIVVKFPFRGWRKTRSTAVNLSSGSSRRRCNHRDAHSISLHRAEGRLPERRLIWRIAWDCSCVALIQRFGTQQALVPTCTKALNARVLKRVIDYIQSHLGEDLSLETIANVAHISPYYFGKLFKISMGETVHQYVMSERLKRARWLLKNRTVPEEEIALACGFSSQSHFATAFRNETGLTPRRFRLLDSY
jgi:AraC-like DNA-binding protein